MWCSSDNFKSFIVNAPWDSVLDSMIGISSREQIEKKSDPFDGASVERTRTAFHKLQTL